MIRIIMFIFCIMTTTYAKEETYLYCAGNQPSIKIINFTDAQISFGKIQAMSKILLENGAKETHNDIILRQGSHAKICCNSTEIPLLLKTTVVKDDKKEHTDANIITKSVEFSQSCFKEGVQSIVTDNGEDIGKRSILFSAAIIVNGESAASGFVGFKDIFGVSETLCYRE